MTHKKRFRKQLKASQQSSCLDLFFFQNLMVKGNKEVVAAVINNNEVIVTELLASGIGNIVNELVCCTPNYGQPQISYTTTVLTLAVRFVHRQMVKRLLELGADPNLECDLTPLGVAVQINDVRLVMMLLEAGADVNTLTHPVKLNSAAGNTTKPRNTSISSSKQTPLHIACRKDFTEVVRCLALHGALDNIVDYNNETPSQVAQRLGKRHLSDIIELAASDRPCRDLLAHLYSSSSLDEGLVIQPGTLGLQRNWRTKRTTNRNYLHLACITRLDRFACFLLSLDNFLPSVDDIDIFGCTPLHYACMFGLFNVAKLLVKRGANVNATDSYNKTPFDISLKYNHMDIALLLIENECIILPKHLSIRNSHGNTLLHIACRQQRAAAVRQLLINGAGLIEMNANCLSPLHLAWQTGNVDVLQELMKFVSKLCTGNNSFYLLVIYVLAKAISISTRKHVYSCLLSPVSMESNASEIVCKSCRKITPEVTFNLMKGYISRLSGNEESMLLQLAGIGRITLELLVADCSCSCNTTILHEACGNAGFSDKTYRRLDEPNYTELLLNFFGLEHRSWSSNRCNCLSRLKVAESVILSNTALDAVDNNDNTAMHIACIRGDLDAIKALASSVKDASQTIMQARNNEYRTPLWYAFVKNHEDCVRYIVQTLQVKPDDSVLHGINDAGNTLLSIIGLKESKLFFSLLDMGARINSSSDGSQICVDFIAEVLKDGHYDKAQQLIKNGCQCYDMEHLHLPGDWRTRATRTSGNMFEILSLRYDFRRLIKWWEWLTEVGFPPDSQTIATLYAIDDRSVLSADELDWLHGVGSTPQSLLLQCVRTIRRQLVLAEPHGATIIPPIDRLPIPNLLKAQLKLSDSVEFPISKTSFILHGFDSIHMDYPLFEEIRLYDYFRELHEFSLRHFVSTDTHQSRLLINKHVGLCRISKVAIRENQTKWMLASEQKRRRKNGHRPYNLIQP